MSKGRRRNRASRDATRRRLAAALATIERKSEYYWTRAEAMIERAEGDSAYHEGVAEGLARAAEILRKAIGKATS